VNKAVRSPGTDQARVVVRPLDQPGDLGWVVQAHGQVYASEYDWDNSFEALVGRIVAAYATEHDPAREAAWMAEVNGQRAGCVFCVAADEETAKLRILLVHPSARGHGLGTRLVDTCVDFARAAGYRRITLWTNDVLGSARRIYQAAGFKLVEQQQHTSFGHNLVGQNWSLDLCPAESP
jgi:GNAT superfamily N-acetyltransferase